jgi:hypothetical protein
MGEWWPTVEVPLREPKREYVLKYSQSRLNRQGREVFDTKIGVYGEEDVALKLKLSLENDSTVKNLHYFTRMEGEV